MLHKPGRTRSTGGSGLDDGVGANSGEAMSESIAGARPVAQHERVSHQEGRRRFRARPMTRPRARPAVRGPWSRTFPTTAPRRRATGTSAVADSVGGVAGPASMAVGHPMPVHRREESSGTRALHPLSAEREPQQRERRALEHHDGEGIGDRERERRGGERGGEQRVDGAVHRRRSASTRRAPRRSASDSSNSAAPKPTSTAVWVPSRAPSTITSTPRSMSTTWCTQNGTSPVERPGARRPSARG